MRQSRSENTNFYSVSWW